MNDGHQDVAGEVQVLPMFGLPVPAQKTAAHPISSKLFFFRGIIISPYPNDSDEFKLSVFMQIYGALSLCPNFNISFAQ